MAEDNYTETFSEFLERKTKEFQKLGLSEEEINQKISDYEAQKDEGSDPRVRVKHRQISETEIKEQKKRILDRIEAELEEDEEAQRQLDEDLHRTLTENQAFIKNLGQKIEEWVKSKPWTRGSTFIITLKTRGTEIFAKTDEIVEAKKNEN